MNNILMAYRGSIAHGMHNPSPDSIDDEDTIGIFIASEDHYLGMKKQKETVEHKEGKIDLVQYELRHFASLATNCNPNVMTILECEESMVITETWAGKMLREEKEMFYSKRAFPAFEGYAHSQLQRMERDVFEGYRGDKRKQMFAQFGYDCKNAAHAIRLARMGCEFFETGLWQLDREDCGDNLELVAIKYGKWTKEQVKEEFFKLIPRMEEAKNKSSLPDEPDREKINDLVKIILKATL